MTDKTISAEQVAILAERVDMQNINHAKLEGLLIGISTAQGDIRSQIAVFSEQMKRFDENKSRLFNLADEHHRRLDKVESDVRVHSWTWKMVGSLASVAMGLGVYVFAQFDALKTTDNSHGNRLTMLEFIIGGRTNTPQQKSEMPIK